MNFYSIQFLVFLLIVLVCYYTVLEKKQWVVLLIASAVFYYWTGVGNFAFLLLTGFTTWEGSQWLAKLSGKLQIVRKDKTIEKTEKEEEKKKIIRKRRIIMWGVIFVNFGILTFLKIFIPSSSNVLGLVLPLGISFYTFQSIGYLLDVYNEKYNPEQDFAKYMLFVGYFPQMIQGPINRYDAMKSQIVEQHRWNGEKATKAVYRIGYGLLKKYAIANIFSGMIATIFDYPVRDYAGATVLMGILLYSAQQYADFSGGIDMVLGVSELFGIHMTENFKRPYFSTSLAEFWRRWHISLGKWMRDYVFYPFALTKPMKNLGKWAKRDLGKHMGRVLPAAIGNIVVFFLVGIWHGVQLHYIIWGLYNGFVIAFSDILAPVYEKIVKSLHINTKSVLYYIFSVIRTFIIVNIGWYFDRIENVKIALYSLKKTILNFNIEMLMDTESKIVFYDYPKYAITLAIVTCAFVFAISVLEEKQIDVRDSLYRKPLGIRWCIYLLIIGMILVASMAVTGTGGFMYANF